MADNPISEILVLGPEAEDDPGQFARLANSGRSLGDVFRRWSTEQCWTAEAGRFPDLPIFDLGQKGRHAFFRSSIADCHHHLFQTARGQ
jgi:hypothetical protein